jgi:hypothetical protein
VDGFSGVVFGEAPSEIAGRADVGLVRIALALEDIDVVDKALLRLLDWNSGILTQLSRSGINLAHQVSAPAGICSRAMNNL